MADRATPPRKPTSDGKLVCSAGPSKGEEFDLSGAPQVVGRAADTDIPIPDTSVSRRHLRVFKRDGEWRVTDLGSGNGTLLNDERVEGEAVLRHSDVLTLGDTQLSFVDVANSTDRAPVPPPSPSGASRARASGASGSQSRPRGSRYRNAVTQPPLRRKRIFSKLLVALLAMGLIGGFFALKREQERRRRKDELISRKEANRNREAGEISREADRLAGEGAWSKAKVLYERVAAIDPSYADVQARIERATHEIPNQTALTEAESQLDESHLGAAAAALSRVTGDTLMFRTLSKDRAAMEAKAQEQVKLARTALDEKRPAQALELTADVLEAIPDQRDAKALHEQASGMVKGSHLRVPAKGPAEVAARFSAGNLQGALRDARSCAPHIAHCRTLIQQMTEFAELQKRLDSLDAKELARLKALEHDISGGRGSSLGDAAGSKQANLLYHKAVAAKAAGELGKAATFAKQALASDPTHPGAKALANELHTKARQIFVEGYQQMESDPTDALKHFKEVLSMTAPGDEYHEKAQRWMEKLKP